MVTCRTYTIEKAPTPGFTLTAGQYEGIGPFNTTLQISYPAGAGQTVKIVDSGPTEDTCTGTDIPLDGSGNATVPYSVTGTHTIYVIQKTGTGGEICCTSFNQTLCKYSNYITFTVAAPPPLYTGNIYFASNPSNAQIWLASSGQTPVYQEVNTPNIISNLPIGLYDYILKMANYNDYTGSVTVLTNQTTNVTANLIPAEGCILFVSTPPGAEIWLAPSGQTPVYQGVNTPALVCGLNLGEYCYKLTLSEYEDKIGCTTLEEGQGNTITQNFIQIPVLRSIIISPISISIKVGESRTFTATCKDQNNNTMICPSLTWESSDTNVGIIDPNTGIFLALGEGTTVITATSETVSGIAIANVTLEVVEAGILSFGNVEKAALLIGLALLSATLITRGTPIKIVQEK